MIAQRSGKDFDAVLGPVIVSIGLCIALCLNFGLKVWTQLTARISLFLTVVKYRSITDQVKGVENLSFWPGSSETNVIGANDWHFVHQDIR